MIDEPSTTDGQMIPGFEPQRSRLGGTKIERPFYFA
jgi:hypothetical protein